MSRIFIFYKREDEDNVFKVQDHIDYLARRAGEVFSVMQAFERMAF